MLVDEVGDVAAGDLVVPVGLVAYLLDPGGGDVPVVAHLVVVEDHGGGNGGEEPADGGVPPGVAVQAGVLLEICDGFAGGPARVAPGADKVEGVEGGLVRVDLVPQKDESVGQLLRWFVPEPHRHSVQGVDAEAPGVFRRVKGGGGSWGAATRHEPKTSLSGPPLSLVLTTLGGNGEPGSGQTAAPSSLTSYPRAVPGSRPVTWTRA